jgi:hypothetical protein
MTGEGPIYYVRKETGGMTRRIATISLVGAAFLAVSPIPLFAYIDPGTGSYLLQILLAGVFASLLALRIFWRKVKVFFTNLFTNKRK